ncbi:MULTISPECIES: M4 family metallopeptidase [Streptomyces]|uniref:Neutral metalloproteinase n=1 Tax=Streptomyces lichenis TaxID=2306967 RepID=A0ABT0I6H0_9ACTN|nr:M4 family metallopeptidase [Streptomyces lichenis]MCK8676926.1 M4 family metallopeptidase [Streptomyces lichenis]
MNQSPFGTSSVDSRVPTLCTIVPPHVLDRLASAEDADIAQAARRTLARDAALRAARRAGVTPALPPAPRSAGTAAAEPRRTVYDAEHRTALPGTRVRGEGEPPLRDATVNRAYAGLGATHDLLCAVYGRDSIDGAGLPLNATVHYDRDYDNAFWNGGQMVFGDGDGRIFLDFTLALDVIAHELAHGLTQYTADLAYQGQSGALNESVSDVFGSLVKQRALGQSAEQADWLVGAGILAPDVSGEGLRSLKAPGTAYDDPALGKDPQPARMADYVRTSSDNGGVHINSGIPNHAFYLFATALGGPAWERAGQVWYDTLTGGELAVDAEFADFSRLTVKTARARFGPGGAEDEALVKAWSTVGLPAEEDD